MLCLPGRQAGPANVLGDASTIVSTVSPEQVSVWLAQA